MPLTRRSANSRLRHLHRLRLAAVLLVSRRKRDNRPHAGRDWPASDGCELDENMFAFNYEVYLFIGVLIFGFFATEIFPKAKPTPPNKSAAANYRPAGQADVLG